MDSNDDLMVTENEHLPEVVFDSPSIDDEYTIHPIDVDIYITTNPLSHLAAIDGYNSSV